MVIKLSILAVAALFALMAYRAIRSGSRLDYGLAAAQLLGVIGLISPYRAMALYFLLLTAVAYLASQVLTGARPIARLLPLAGAAAAMTSLVLIS